MKRVLLSILISILIQNINAQEYFPVKQFTISQGLSSNRINDVIYDDDGFIWVATENGLNRFDGYQFKTFIYSPFDSNTIVKNKIIDLEIDYNNKLWILYSNGLQILNLNTGIFSSIDKLSSSEEILNHPPIIKVSVDRRILWYFNNSQVHIYHTDSLKKQASYHIENISLNTNAVSVYGDSLVYSIYHGMLIEYKKTSGRFNSKTLHTNKFSTVYCIKPIDNNRLMLATNNGIYTYQIDEQIFLRVCRGVLDFKKDEHLIFTFQNFKAYLISQDYLYEFDLLTNATRKILLKDLNIYNTDIITNGIADQTQLIWLSTSKGLLCVNPHPTEFKYLLTKDLIPGDSGKIKSVTFDHEKVWIALQHHIYLIDVKHREIIYKIDLRRIISAKSELIINQISQVSDNEILIATNAGIVQILKKSHNGRKIYDTRVLFENTIIKSVAKDFLNRYWIATNDGLILYNLTSGNSKLVKNFKYNNKLLSLESVGYLNTSGQHLWFVTNDGLVKYNYANGDYQVFYPNNDTTFYFPDLMVSSLRIDKLGQPWLSTSYGFAYVNSNDNSLKLIGTQTDINYSISAMEISGDKLWYASEKGISKLERFLESNRDVINYSTLTGNLDYNNSVSAISDSGNMVFTTNEGILYFSPNNFISARQQRRPNISSIKLIDNTNKEMTLHFDVQTFIYKKNIKYCEVELSAIDYYSPRKSYYKYRISKGKKEGEWELINTNKIVLSGLAPGRYKLEIASADENAMIKPSDYVNIIVESAFYESKFAFLIYGIVVIFIVYLLIRFRTRRLSRLNRAYREREVISKQIEEQKEQLSLKNKNITDSINYAKRIQMAMMPSAKKFHSIFPDAFILHLPKDIVSGDFYWVSEVEDKVFMAAVDCTGHGVPGAFMSIIGFELFRRITDEKRIKQPAEILNNLSKGFEAIFSDVENMTLRDGMDLALCSFDKKNSLLEFAGAFNPLYLVRENTITEIKGDRFSVGLDTNEEEQVSFKNHVIPVKKGDIIYIFTDGFADQFGGPEGKKYKYRRFRHLLLALHQLPMDKQKQFLQKSILEWKGQLDQVDDILVMGVKVDYDNDEDK